MKRNDNSRKPQSRIARRRRLARHAFARARGGAPAAVTTGFGTAGFSATEG
ncbi:MAG: hypothetical protein QNI96_13585 [Woeseiaceae bacterium]|nr:hypothetical protein [Woeseiaceae bacterium]